MAYLEQDYRLDYFADHQWVDPPAAMLESLLVQALGGHPAFGAVSADGRGIRANLRLDTVIEALYQDFRPRPSQGRVALRVRLVDLGTGRIIDTRLIEDSAPAPSDDAYGGVQAINRALGRLLPEIAEFAGRAASRSRSEWARNPDSQDEGH
jgi:cholesterol transport system auxiliary component